MSLTVHIHDDSGQEPDRIVTVADDDFYVVCTGTCRVDNATFHANGTAVLTIRGQRAIRSASPAGRSGQS